jgi:hypothetical protein
MFWNVAPGTNGLYSYDCCRYMAGGMSIQVIYNRRWYVKQGHSLSHVKIRVRIDPPHPLVCRKRRLNGAVLRMRPEKPRSRVTAGVAR